MCVHFIVPPVVQPVLDSEYLVAVVNQSVVISFTVYDASPEITNVVWTFVNSSGYSGLLYPNSNSQKYIFSSDLLSVTISFVELSDEGKYSVMVENPAGSSSAVVTVDVQGLFSCVVKALC